MIRPIDTVPESMDGDYEVFFGETRYLLTLTPDSLGDETMWGRSSHNHLWIHVRTADDDGRLAVDFVQDIIMHELIHAAMWTSGYFVADDAYSEEAVAGVLSKPLLRLFADPRNAPVMGLLFPPPIVRFPLEGMVELKDVNWDRLVTIPDENPKFGHFQQGDLAPYIDALDKTVSDLAGLAARDDAMTAAEPATTPPPCPTCAAGGGAEVDGYLF